MATPKVSPLVMLSCINIVCFVLSLSLDYPLGAYWTFQGLWISRWIYLAAGGLGLFITYFENDDRVVNLSILTAGLASLFGLAATILLGQIGGDSPRFWGVWLMFIVSFFAMLVNAAIVLQLLKDDNLTPTGDQSASNRRAASETSNPSPA